MATQQANRSRIGPSYPARICDSVLKNDEVSSSTVETLVSVLFDKVEEGWHESGSPFQRWYRRAATGPNAVHDEEHATRFEKGRLVAWKTGKPFEPKNLFFRCVDTARLLPMHLADFRVQFYAHTEFWERHDRPEIANSRERCKQETLMDSVR